MGAFAAGVATEDTEGTEMEDEKKQPAEAKLSAEQLRAIGLNPAGWRETKRRGWMTPTPKQHALLHTLKEGKKLAL